MDIYYPEDMNGPTPAVVYVHGGGWRSGDKSEGVGTSIVPGLREAGFIVISIDYRLAPEYKFPAEIQDVQCALRHLRANASRYNLDPQRIGAMGGSAGGHLVALAGLADDSAPWGIGGYVEPYASQSSRVQAVVDLFGPTDLTKLASTEDRVTGDQVFGAAGPDDPILKIYSPVTYITPDDPPFLILQGLEDQRVPSSQSQLLYDLLAKTGVPAQLVIVKNAGHGFLPIGGPINPTLLELKEIVVQFLSQHLK
jgi:acetyl esterase/lipase